MPFAPVSPATLRLLACVEAFSHEEEGAVGHDDWPALASLLQRELAVLTGLAGATSAAERADPRLLARARALRERYAALDRKAAAARARATAELADMDAAGRRLRAVRGAYATPARESGGLHSAA